MNCLSCGATTTNGLALCEMCQYAASQWLTYLPVYFRNLSRQQRPGRPNGSMGTAGEWLIRRGEVDTSAIQTALGKAVNDLTTWARTLQDDRDVQVPATTTEAEMVGAICAALADNLTSIATLEWAGQCLRDIGKHEGALRGLTESAVPGWYAGRCLQSINTLEGPDLCGFATYVVPGLTWTTCAGCGTTTAARDHLPAVLEEARDWIARPRAVAEAVVALVDTEQSIVRLYDRIRQWAVRERIPAYQTSRATRDYGWDEDTERIVVVDEEVLSPPKYRLGDVLDLLLTEGATRLTSRTTAKAG